MIKINTGKSNITLIKDVIKGDPGASAYEIALANGFEGTEEEWLLSLEGEPGKPGDKGERGAAGIYVGDQEPTDADTLVWVDPDEELNVVITEEQVLELIEANKTDLTDYYTKAETEALVNAKEVDLSDYYTKAEVDNLIPDVSAYQTEAQVQALIDSAVASITDGEAVSY